MSLRLFADHCIRNHPEIEPRVVAVLKSYLAAHPLAQRKENDNESKSTEATPETG